MPEQTLPIKAKTAGDAAALWWVLVLTNPKLDNGTVGTNPMMDSLVKMAEDGPHPHIEELPEFGRILAYELNEQLEAGKDDFMIQRYGISLGVDYDPDHTLSQAADKAGLRLHMGQWPWKTHMTVKPNEVIVSYGYRAEPMVIWSKSV